MASYPKHPPGEVAPPRRPGGKPAKPPRVWKDVATLAIMAVLAGAVTGAGVLESNSLHSMPISASAAAPPAATAPPPAPSTSPDQR